MTTATASPPSLSARPAPVPALPDPEVRERPTRRRFTAAYKLRVLQEADSCTAPGQLGALLRREGLYSSHLVTWRRQRDTGARAALGQRRGRKPADREAIELARLRQENARLAHRLEVAQTIIAIQKKVSTLLGIPLEPDERPQ
jgi:transposase